MNIHLSERGRQEFVRLIHDVRLGFDADVDVKMVNTHTSKSTALPIVGADHDGWNTSVAWYGYNYHYHWSAFRFKKAIPATLLYPVSGLMGRGSNSGHETHCPLSPITNFTRDYWNRRPLEGYANYAGGWTLATTLRYLEAVSRIDQKALFDCVMDKSRYGVLDNIDGNAIDFNELCRIVGIPEVGTYQEHAQVPPNDIIRTIRIDWFGIKHSCGPANVSIEPHDGVLLPAATGGEALYIDPAATQLRDHLDDTVQLPWTEGTQYSDKRILNFVPANMFRHRNRSQEEYVARKAAFDATPWLVSGAYNVTGLDVPLIRFVVPNPLDAVLFVKWWIDAAIPCAEAMLQEKAKTHGQS